MTAQSNITPESIVSDLRYLQLLSRSFPTIADASTEIINLEAILNLPKGTEHFLTDIHGEYEAFQHVLKNASGAVKRKVNEIFGNTLRESEKKEISTLIYYPEEKLQLVKAREKDLDDWYLITLNQLVKVCQNVSSKYTRSKVRKSLPKEFSYIIQELLHESSIEPNKHAYINVIISTIISTKRADDFIIAMCNLIQRLTIDSLHIVGDIYDRGPGAHIIMDTLCNYHNFDIQWGNHDILWIGAASGNTSCMANVIRMSMRYGNLGTLEDGYGINLLPLATFAMDTYADDPCTIFAPKMNFADSAYNEKTLRLITQMHKAITIIQFKLEADIINRRPEFGMENRKLLEKIDAGYDVVYASYDTKRQAGWRNLGSWANSKMTEIMLGKPPELVVNSYFAARRFVVEEMLRYEHCYPYVIGLVLRSTKHICNVPVHHRAREEGSSGYTLRKLLNLWMNGFTSFSVKPLRIATYFGTLFAAAGFVYLIYIVIDHFTRGAAPMGVHHGAAAAFGRHDSGRAGHHRRVCRPHLHVRQRRTAVCCKGGHKQ